MVTRAFGNNPSMTNQTGEGQIRRYSHQPLTVEHHGINMTIKPNGKVVLSKVAEEQSVDGVIDYDEIEIPASLVFKLADLLRATRKIEYVTVKGGE